jgi:5-carboxymethyl-2-hydroxymuconate isomerase
MPHLHFEHSAKLGELVDLAAFAQHMRAAIIETGHFPEGGVRVRGFAASSEAVADGDSDRLFLDIEFRIGQGRSEEDRRTVLETLYSAARNWLEPRLGERPFALSMELREIDAGFSIKSWNSIRTALARQAG